MSALSNLTATVDTPEFLELLGKFAHESSCEDFNEEEYNKARAGLCDHLDAHTARAVAEALAPVKRQNLELIRVSAEQRLQEQRLEIALARAKKMGEARPIDVALPEQMER